MLRKLALIAALVASACTRRLDLPKLFPVPEANLVAETGKPVKLSELKGSVVVYDFIFTNCGATCPMMTEQMRQITQKIDKSAPVRFVSITVDPDRDTPQQLLAYANKFRNDSRWTFLTGQKADVLRVSVEGFKLAAVSPSEGNEPLLHSTKFAIADKSGMIRDYWGSTDGGATDHVVKVVNQLLEE